MNVSDLITDLGLFWKIVRAWLASTKINGKDAITYTIETLGALAGFNLTGPIGSLIVPILEGIIMGGQHHDATTDPATGASYAAGPAVSPAHAVALAVNLANQAGAALGLEPAQAVIV